MLLPIPVHALVRVALVLRVQEQQQLHCAVKQQAVLQAGTEARGLQEEQQSLALSPANSECTEHWVHHAGINGGPAPWGTQSKSEAGGQGEPLDNCVLQICAYHDHNHHLALQTPLRETIPYAHTVCSNTKLVT